MKHCDTISFNGLLAIGVGSAIGAIVALVFSPFFISFQNVKINQIPNEAWINFLAVLLGAIIASILAFKGQWFIFQKEQKALKRRALYKLHEKTLADIKKAYPNLKLKEGENIIDVAQNHYSTYLTPCPQVLALKDLGRSIYPMFLVATKIYRVEIRKLVYTDYQNYNSYRLAEVMAIIDSLISMSRMLAYFKFTEESSDPHMHGMREKLNNDTLKHYCLYIDENYNYCIKDLQGNKEINAQNVSETLNKLREEDENIFRSQNSTNR